MGNFFEKIGASLKKALYVILLALLILFIVQNMESVNVKFLFYGFEMPLVIIIFVSFVLGALITKVFSKKNKNLKSEAEEKPAS
ncbi:MAG: LapA family protein [Bacteroidales bacterium]|nr:LapA family protein [Bacteroidales bacterium]